MTSFHSLQTDFGEIQNYAVQCGETSVLASSTSHGNAKSIATIPTEKSTIRCNNSLVPFSMAYKYQSFEQIKSMPLPRRYKRLLYYVKQKTLGLLKLKSSSFTITYSQPVTPYEVKTEYELVTRPAQILFLRNQAVNTSEHSIFPRTEDYYTRVKHPFYFSGYKEKFDDLNARCKQLGYSAVVLRTNGLELPINSSDELLHHLVNRGMGPDWINYLGFARYLNGGGREKGKKRRGKKRRKRTKKQLARGSELGLRNPVDMTRYPPTVTDLWRYEVTLAADGSGQVSQFYALRNPLAAANSSGTYPRAPEFAKLYDEYKVVSLTVLVDPHTPSIAPIGRMAIAVDYDSIGSGTYTYSDLRDNQYMRDYLVTNQISYVAKDVPLSEGTYRGVTAVIHQRGWYDFNSPPEEGFIALAGEGFSASSAVAYVLLSMKVKMRPRMKNYSR